MYILVARWFFATLSFVSRTKQRLVALFFITLTLFGASSGTAFALTATSTSPAPIPTVTRQNIPAPQSTTSSVKAAADSFTPIGGGAGFRSLLTSKTTTDPLGMPTSPISRIAPHELTDKRTANTSSYLNQNGSITRTQYMTPHFY